MKDRECARTIAEMTASWPQKAMSQPETVIWRNVLVDVDYEVAQQAIDELRREVDWQPTIHQFVEAARDVQRRRASASASRRGVTAGAPISCQQCGDEGWTCVGDRSLREDWLVCVCEAGATTDRPPDPVRHFRLDLLREALRVKAGQSTGQIDKETAQAAFAEISAAMQADVDRAAQLRQDCTGVRRPTLEVCELCRGSGWREVEVRSGLAVDYCRCSEGRAMANAGLGEHKKACGCFSCRFGATTSWAGAKVPGLTKVVKQEREVRDPTGPTYEAQEAF